MTKYYDQTAEDGWKRIAVVDWDEIEGEGLRFGKEIQKNELPSDFESWQVYDHYAHDDASVKIFSVRGE